MATLIIGTAGAAIGGSIFVFMLVGAIITNVAVLESGWLAGGNMARNTTIIRSNYLWDESSGMYEHSLKLWEQLPD